MKNESIYKIRPANESDANQILEIYSPIVSDSVISFEETVPSLSEMQARIKRISSTHHWLVAIDQDSKIVGYVYASQHRERAAYRWIVEVTAYVREGYHGQGIASMLYSRLFELLKQQNFTQALALIALPNQASVKLHEKMGFKYQTTFKDIGFKLGKWHDVGWWQYTINSSKSLPDEPTKSLGKPFK